MSKEKITDKMLDEFVVALKEHNIYGLCYIDKNDDCIGDPHFVCAALSHIAEQYPDVFKRAVMQSGVIKAEPPTEDS